MRRASGRRSGPSPFPHCRRRPRSARRRSSPAGRNPRWRRRRCLRSPARGGWPGQGLPSGRRPRPRGRCGSAGRRRRTPAGAAPTPWTRRPAARRCSRASCPTARWRTLPPAALRGSNTAPHGRGRAWRRSPPPNKAGTSPAPRRGTPAPDSSAPPRRPPPMYRPPPRPASHDPGWWRAFRSPAPIHRYRCRGRWPGCRGRRGSLSWWSGA